MRIVYFGDMLCDYYIRNGVNLSISGGGDGPNVLVNLSKYFKCAFYGVCGKDSEGNAANLSLKSVGIDTYIRFIEGETKTRFYYDYNYSLECPYCKRFYGYDGSKIRVDDVILLKGDYIVVDNLNEVTVNILKKYDNEAFLVLNDVEEIDSYLFDELTSILKNRFRVISFNEQVYYYLKDKFIVDSYDLYDAFSPDILVINRGIRGVDVIYNNKFLKKIFENVNQPVCYLGVEDAIISEFIRTYIEENEVTDKTISKSLIRASTNLSKCVKSYGARGHILKPYKVLNYKKCICCSIDVE